MRDNSFLRPLLLLALAPGLACLEKGGSSGAPVVAAATAPPPCVHFEDLRAFLPTTLEGFTRSRDTASTGRYGEVSVSEAERTFTRGEEREVKVRIVDTTLGEKLGRVIRTAAEGGRRRDPSDPTAPIFWEDTVGFVRYDAEDELAEASLLVGERYVVAVTSRGFPGTVEIRRVARGIDLAGLAQLR